MNQLFKLTFLFLLITLFYSCAEKKLSENEIHTSEFVNAPADTLKFTSGIRAIFQDTKGNFWFGSLQEGVCLFDGKTFTYFTNENGLNSNQIYTIQEDNNGIIWFDTANGASSYNQGIITNHTLQVDTDSQKEWMKTDHDLWFNAGNNVGVYRYDGHEMNYLAFPNPKVTNPTNVYFVTGIAEGKNDMIWIATYAGVFGYNGQSFSVINDDRLGFNQEGRYLHIRSILEDTKGRLWIGNNGIGVLLHNEDTTINFSDQMGLIHPTSFGMGALSPEGSLEHVFTIEEDLYGNIWFGDRDTGVWKYDGKSMVNYTKKDGLSDNFVTAMYTDKRGELWFGLANGDVYTFNGTSFDNKL